MKTIHKSGEDYLEAIYTLSKGKEHVHSVEIAKHMNVSKPSICRALQNLSEQGCIEKEKYGAVKLTAKGLEIAKTVENKHKAVKMLLVDVLKVSEEAAEVDACKIEHNISEETTKKLFAYFGIK